jgi:hypothetical protein
MSNDSNISPELRFWSLFSVAHAGLTIVVTLCTAVWWTQNYEETFMRSDKAVTSPLFRFFEILTKGLQLPLGPLIYSPTAQTNDFPVILAVFLNSAIAALIALIVWLGAKKLIAQRLR